MSVRRLGIVGAGVMGTGIAESAAAAGLKVSIYEPIESAIQGSRERLCASLRRAVERKKRSRADAYALHSKISWSSAPEWLLGSQLVIEAIVEDAGVKSRTFRQLDGLLADEVVLASNTSSLPITGLAAATGRPDRVVGLRFFSPVPIMKLVEVVAGQETSEATVAKGEGFVSQLGKTAIRTKDRSDPATHPLYPFDDRVDR